ncbi:hypothetical protein Tco_0761361, partial [Tanacetum coccineum]
YGYCKNHKKTVKVEQRRTQDGKEHTRPGDLIARWFKWWSWHCLILLKQGTRNAAKRSEEIKFGAIKLEDMAKLVPNVKVDFKDLDSLEDDPIIVVDDNEEDEEEDKNKEIHFLTNEETLKDISASHLLSMVFDSASSKAGDQGVPLAGQADTMPG